MYIKCSSQILMAGDKDNYSYNFLRVSVKEMSDFRIWWWSTMCFEKGQWLCLQKTSKNHTWFKFCLHLIWSSFLVHWYTSPRTPVLRGELPGRPVSKAPFVMQSASSPPCQNGNPSPQQRKQHTPTFIVVLMLKMSQDLRVKLIRNDCIWPIPNTILGPISKCQSVVQSWFLPLRSISEMRFLLSFVYWQILIISICVFTFHSVTLPSAGSKLC